MGATIASEQTAAAEGPVGDAAVRPVRDAAVLRLRHGRPLGALARDRPPPRPARAPDVPGQLVPQGRRRRVTCGPGSATTSGCSTGSSAGSSTRWRRRSSPIGLLPRRHDLDLAGPRSVGRRIRTLITLDPARWRSEARRIEQHSRPLRRAPPRAARDPAAEAPARARRLRVSALGAASRPSTGRAPVDPELTAARRCCGSSRRRTRSTSTGARSRPGTCSSGSIAPGSPARPPGAGRTASPPTSGTSRSAIRSGSAASSRRPRASSRPGGRACRCWSPSTPPSRPAASHPRRRTACSCSSRSTPTGSRCRADLAAGQRGGARPARPRRAAGGGTGADPHRDGVAALHGRGDGAAPPPPVPRDAAGRELGRPRARRHRHALDRRDRAGVRALVDAAAAPSASTRAASTSTGRSRSGRSSRSSPGSCTPARTACTWPPMSVRPTRSSASTARPRAA